MLTAELDLLRNDDFLGRRCEQGLVMGMSKIAVDLQARTFEIEVPDDKVEATIDLLSKLFAEVPHSAMPSSPQTGGTPPTNGNPNNASQSKAKDDKVEPSKGKKKSNFKPKTYELVDLGLSTEQRKELNEFTSTKSQSGKTNRLRYLVSN